MRLATAALCALLVGMPCASAAAQSGTLNRFRPGETNEDDFQLSRPTDLGDLRFATQMTFDYAMNPLVWESIRGDEASEVYSLVEHQLTGTLGLALGIADRVVIFAGLPMVMQMDGVDASRVEPGVSPAEGAGIGDVYLGARARMFGEEDEIGAFALQLTATLPSSGDTSYRGDPFITLHTEVLGELRPGLGSRFVINLGFRAREETTTTFSNIQFRHELTYALGFAIPLWTDEGDDRTHFDANAQIFGTSALALAGERDGTTVEWLAGLKIFHASGVVAGFNMGTAFLTRGLGSPDYRAVVNLGWMMPGEPGEPPVVDRDGDGILDEVDECPDEPEDIDEFEDENGCPDPDNDGDGILDEPDECPNEPETVNEHEDEDGCPDEVGDRDEDGILDHVDECPDDPEDIDEFEDENGCPDPDNDEDGILDGTDDCPNEPGPVENRGCPDTDRDGDTVVDRLDNCPDEPGTVANHGCVEEQRVFLSANGIEILDRVYFRTNRATILRRSYPLLINVAQVLNNHPEIAHIRVEGHTDVRGRRAHNMRLSQQRAQSVVDFLVDDGGVTRSRLSAQGFGPDQLVVQNARTRDDHARNRRVEFNIWSEAPTPSTGDPGPSAEAADR